MTDTVYWSINIALCLFFIVIALIFQAWWLLGVMLAGLALAIWTLRRRRAE